MRPSFGGLFHFKLMSLVSTFRTSRDVLVMSAFRGRSEVAIALPDFRVCEGFRMPAMMIAPRTRGRRTQTSKGGNRGTSGNAERQTLGFGFERDADVFRVPIPWSLGLRPLGEDGLHICQNTPMEVPVVGALTLSGTSHS